MIDVCRRVWTRAAGMWLEFNLAQIDESDAFETVEFYDPASDPVAIERRGLSFVDFYRPGRSHSPDSVAETCLSGSSTKCDFSDRKANGHPELGAARERHAKGLIPTTGRWWRA
jgi:hypothetical protein